MKIYIYPEDWHVYTFVEDLSSGSSNHDIKVETDKVEKWKKVFEDFEEVQSELRHLFYTK